MSYFVWNPEKDFPKRSHKFLDEARAEAESLCFREGGTEIFILAPIASVKQKQIPFVWINLPIPSSNPLFDIKR